MRERWTWDTWGVPFNQSSRSELEKTTLYTWCLKTQFPCVSKVFQNRPCPPRSFVLLTVKDRGQFVSEEGYLSNNETCKTKNLPLNVLSWLPAKWETLNRKSCQPEPLRGTAGGEEEGGQFASMGKKKSDFFFKIYVIDKWIDSEWDGLWNTTGILLVSTCVSTHHHIVETEKCVWPLCY